MQKGRDAMLKRWVAKTSTSPFAVSLHAEDERIVEENRIKKEEEKQRSLILKLQKDRAKNEIILSALADHEYMLQLRNERRVLLDEEQKLKGLMDLTKLNRPKASTRVNNTSSP